MIEENYFMKHLFLKSDLKVILFATSKLNNWGEFNKRIIYKGVAMIK